MDGGYVIGDLHPLRPTQLSCKPPAIRLGIALWGEIALQSSFLRSLAAFLTSRFS